MKLGEGKKEAAADISEGWEDDEWEVSLLHNMQGLPWQQQPFVSLSCRISQRCLNQENLIHSRLVVEIERERNEREGAVLEEEEVGTKR